MATKKKAASSTATARKPRKKAASKSASKAAPRAAKKSTSKSSSSSSADPKYPDMVVVEREIGGRMLSIETGRMMKLSDGACVARYADTMVLAAVNSNKAPDGIDFFPLTVDYREKTSAAGMIPGGFFKREARPTTKEIRPVGSSIARFGRCSRPASSATCRCCRRSSRRIVRMMATSSPRSLRSPRWRSARSRTNAPLGMLAASA